jgi:cytochrome P450
MSASVMRTPAVARAVIPWAPGRLPLFGHALAFVRDPWGFVAGLDADGGLTRVRLGPFTVVAVCDPDLVRQVLLDDRTFDKGGPFFERTRVIVGNGMATCPHSDHRRQRRLCQPAFHPSRLPAYAGTMSAQIAAMTRAWDDGQIINVTTQMHSLVNTILMQTIFSDGLPSPVTHQFLADLTVLLKGVYPRLLMPSWALRLPTPGNLRYQHAVTRLRRTAAMVIAERRASGADHGDLLTALLTARDDAADGAPALTDAEITDQLVIFYLAGTESTAVTLSWALYLLARHPGIQHRLHAEADTVLAGRLAATYDDLPRLELTGRIVTETLRLYPPAWMITRTVTAGTRLGDHLLPAGTPLLYSPYLIHHRGDLYRRPEQFDPDRWAPGQPQPPRHAIIPFGSGARKCIGDTFAITEATLTLATIAARWHLHTPPGSRPAHPTRAASLQPPRDLRLRITARIPGVPAQKDAQKEKKA